MRRNGDTMPGPTDEAMVHVTVTGPDGVVLGSFKHGRSKDNETALSVVDPAAGSQRGQHREAAVGPPSKQGHARADRGVSQPIPLHHVNVRVHEVTAQREEVLAVHLCVAVHDRNEVVWTPTIHQVTKAKRHRSTNPFPGTFQDDQFSMRFGGLRGLFRPVHGAIIDEHHEVDLGG